jgi:D-proline reductase (dithiol) PrdB
MDILENKDQWLANFQAGWLAHFNQTGECNWDIYNRPKNSQEVTGPGIDLSKSRLILITSAGSYLSASQEPYDAEDLLGDYSIRTYPANTPFADLAFAHTHYDHSGVDEDPQVLVPLRQLEDMASEGLIGEIAPTVISFHGYAPNAARFVDETIPAMLEVALQEQAQAALLVPA